MLLGTFGLGPNLVPTPGMPKTNAFGHIRGWAQFGPNSRNAQNECFWAHSGLSPICSQLPKPECAQKHSFWAFRELGPNWAQARMCPKAFVLGIPGVGTNLGPSPNVPKSIRFGHSGSWDQIGPKPECAQKHSFWAFRELGPNWAQARMCPKAFVLGISGVGTKLGPSPNVPKSIRFGNSGSWDQIGPKPECAQKHSFWAFRVLGPNWAQARMCPKAFVLGIPGVGTKLGPSPNVPKSIRFGNSGSWDQIGPKSECAQKHSFWAFRELGPNWAQARMCPKAFVLGIPGVGTKLGPSPNVSKSIRFGHFGSWDQIGPKPECGQKHSFWAFRELGPNWAQARMCPKAFVLGIPGVGTKLGPSPNVPKSIRFGHFGSWDQIGPKPECAQKHSFWEFRELGPNWAQARMCPKAFVLGIPGVGTKLGPSPNVPKSIRFGHSGSWDQIGPKPECAQKHSFWEFWELGPNWAQVRMCPKAFVLGIPGVGTKLGPSPNVPKSIRFGHSRSWDQNWAQAQMCPKAFVFGISGVGTKLGPSPNVPKSIRFGNSGSWDQIDPKPECAQKHSFWAFRELGPNWAQARMCPKAFVLGIPGVGTKLGPSPNVPKSIRFGHFGSWDQIGPKPECAQKHSFWEFRELVPTPEMPKTNALGHIRAWAQFGPNSRNAQNECFWAHSGLGPIWSQLPKCPKRMLLGTFGLGPNLVPTPGMPKANAFGHIRAWAQLVPTPEMPKTKTLRHIRAGAQFGPNSRNAQNECFWAHSGLGPIWSQLPKCPKRMLLGTFGLGPNLVPTPGMPKTNAFGHIRAWAQFGPNSRNAQNECFWAHSGLGPIWSQLPEFPKRMLLGTFGLRPNLVPTPGIPKTNAFGHIRAWAQFGPNSRNAQNECFWAHSGLGPNWSQLPECRKRMLLGTFGLGPNLVPTRGMPKTNAFGHIRAWAQFGPNSRNAQNECSWAHSGLGPIWSQLPECPKRMLLGTFGLGPNLVPTPGIPKTNAFGHIRAWAQFGPNSRNAQNECFWAHSGLGPIWSQLPECPKRMLLGTFGLGPNLVPTPGIPKTNAFGHIRAWAQFGPNSRNAQNECFWAHSGLGPIWSQLPECPKRMLLGTFGLGPNLVPTPGMPKTNAFGHIRAWAQFGPNSRNAQNECSWAHSGLSPIWSQLPECRKRMFLGTFGLGPNLVPTPGMPKTNAFGHIRAWAQLGPNSRNSQNEWFWAHSGLGPIWSQLPEFPKRMLLGTFGLGPNLVPTPGNPKTNAFGHIRAWAQFGPNSRNSQNECFWAHSGLGTVWSQLPKCPKRMLLGTFGLGPNLVPTPGMPKTNAFGHIRAWAQFGPNSRNAQNECFWAHSGLGPIWSQLPKCPKRMLLGTFGLGPNLVPTPGMPKTNAFGHIRAWAQFGPNSRNAQNECFWAHSGLGPIWSQLPEFPKRMLLGTFGLGPNLVPTPEMAKTNAFGHIRAWAQFGPNSRNAQNECFWAHSDLGPIWSQLPECPKRMLLGTFGLGPNLVPTPEMPKTNAFGHIRARAQFGPNSRKSQNECFWAHSGLGPIWSQLPKFPKRMLLGTFGLGPNLVPTPEMPKTNAFGHIRAWAQFGPNTRNAQNECFWAHSGLGPIWSQLPECPKRMLLGTFGLGPNLVPTPGIPKTNAFGHIRAWAQFGPNTRNAQNECFWAHSG